MEANDAKAALLTCDYAFNLGLAERAKWFAGLEIQRTNR